MFYRPTIFITPYLFNNASIALLPKWVPRSLIIALGKPKRDMMLVLRKLATVFESLVIVAIDSTHLET